MLASLLQPLIWAAITTSVVLVVGLLLTRRRPVPPMATVVPPLGPADDSTDSFRDVSEFWEPPQSDPQDRREKTRRQGQRIPIRFRLSNENRSTPAYVLDRNSSGIRLAVAQPVEVGMYVSFLPDQAPDGTPWAEATISWCKTVDGQCEVGCRFTETLPANLLLLFG